MILISHRGNLDGKFESYENEPTYIDEAISEGFDVEVDIWYINNMFYLGHDNPQYGVSNKWLEERKDRLWIHCKNTDAIEQFNEVQKGYNYFWHQEDTLTLTSKGFLWVYPGKQKIKNSIAVMPELYNDDTSSCVGICSDFIKKYGVE